jgi:hypothetical protein
VQSGGLGAAGQYSFCRWCAGLSRVGQGLGTPAARECYRWIALIVVLFFLTHLAESARTALGRALGRRVTGRLGERVMMAASEPATRAPRSSSPPPA